MRAALTIWHGKVRQSSAWCGPELVSLWSGEIILNFTPMLKIATHPLLIPHLGDGGHYDADRLLSRHIVHHKLLTKVTEDLPNTQTNTQNLMGKVETKRPHQ